MHPHSHLKEMAGPVRPAQRCQVAHIVSIHKAELRFPCIPNSTVPTTQCLYGPVIHSGSAGLAVLRGESRPSSERPTWSFGPRAAQLRKSSLPLNGAGISWLANRGGALCFSQPQFPQPEHGIHPDECQDSFLLKSSQTYMFLFIKFCSVPSTVSAITYILSNISEWTSNE